MNNMSTGKAVLKGIVKFGILPQKLVSKLKIKRFHTKVCLKRFQPTQSCKFNTIKSTQLDRNKCEGLKPPLESFSRIDHAVIVMSNNY